MENSQDSPLHQPLLDEELLRLSKVIRSKELISVLHEWASARGPNRLPHPSSIDRTRLQVSLFDVVAATVSSDARGEPTFRWSELSLRLKRLLGKPLKGNKLTADSHQASSHYAAYRMCWQLERCTYDYVRIRGAEPIVFERLLLPFSRDGGKHVTDITGLIKIHAAGPPIA